MTYLCGRCRRRRRPPGSASTGVAFPRQHETRHHRGEAMICPSVPSDSVITFNRLRTVRIYLYAERTDNALCFVLSMAKVSAKRYKMGTPRTPKMIRFWT